MSLVRGRGNTGISWMPCPTGYPARSPSVGHTGRETNLPNIWYVRTEAWLYKSDIPGEITVMVS